MNHEGQRGRNTSGERHNSMDAFCERRERDDARLLSSGPRPHHLATRKIEETVRINAHGAPRDRWPAAARRCGRATRSRHGDRRPLQTANEREPLELDLMCVRRDSRGARTCARSHFQVGHGSLRIFLRTGLALASPGIRRSVPTYSSPEAVGPVRFRRHGYQCLLRAPVQR